MFVYYRNHHQYSSALWSVTVEITVTCAQPRSQSQSHLQSLYGYCSVIILPILSIFSYVLDLHKTEALWSEKKGNENFVVQKCTIMYSYVWLSLSQCYNDIPIHQTTDNCNLHLYFIAKNRGSVLAATKQQWSTVVMELL